MKRYQIVLLLVLFYSFSCSVADNQACTEQNLLDYATNGVPDKIEACYKSGANILVSDEKGNAIYTIALENGNNKLAGWLQEVQYLEWQKSQSPLDAQLFYDAIEYNNLSMVTEFISRDFDIKTKHINGVAPVVYAIFNESNVVLELLLNNGVDVDYIFDTRPLICIAAMFDQQESVEILLSHGADVKDIDGSGVTSLMFAAKDGYIDLVKFLLLKGADKKAVDIEEMTAFDMAKASGHKEVMSLLSE